MSDPLLFVDTSESNVTVTGNLTVSNILTVDTLTVNNVAIGNMFTEIDISSPYSSTGSWTESANDAYWGAPRFDSTFTHRRYADAPAELQYTIPTGMKSAYLSQLVWSSGGYADIYGVKSNGDQCFLRRINTYQDIRNLNNTLNYDGASITFLGSGLEDYVRIKILNKSGRIHISGLAFSTTKNVGTEGTGIVHPTMVSRDKPIVMCGRTAGDVSSGTIVLNSALYNNKSMYNTGNGRFTCPVGYAGFYQITFQGLHSNGYQATNTRWYKNGVVFDWGALHNNFKSLDLHHPSFCSVIIVYLAEGDYMDMRVITASYYGGSTIHSTATCQFLCH
jgi:hypothetical protein